jgi:thioesterase III
MLGSAHSYDLTIHERHLDTFGHVNNATYLDLLEEARWDLITRNGYGLDEIDRRQAGPTVVEANLRFVREIRNRERITVKSWTESYSGKICRFAQQMLNEKEELCCDATFVMGLFDLQARKLLLPTPEWLRALGLSEAL